MADEENKVEEAGAVEAPKAEAAPKADKKAGKASKTDGYTPRLKADYDERIVPAMIEKFGYKNKLEVPKLDKIVINMGVGEAPQDKKKVETAAAEKQTKTKQKPENTKTKKTNAQFK